MLDFMQMHRNHKSFTIKELHKVKLQLSYMYIENPIAIISVSKYTPCETKFDGRVCEILLNVNQS